jgi:molybdenum cofactor synthesis domain-containing protein
MTPSAALIVVGNELLSAKVPDENGPYASRRLREMGIRLAVLLTLPDRVDVLVEAVRRERQRVDWLFTSGGIGPTHDDVTVRAVAQALGRPLERNPDIAANVRRWSRRRGTELTETALRMADVPAGTRLVGDPSFPVMIVENVVMLPGPPRFFRSQFDLFTAGLQASPFRMVCLFLAVSEDSFAPALEQVVAAHPLVEIGSYPRFDEGDHRVMVTFEGKDAEPVEAAVRQFVARLPDGALLRREGP